MRSAESGYRSLIKPFIDGLIRMGVRPNSITTVGALLVVVSAVAFGLGWIRLGGLLLLLSGVVDTFDGMVARSTGQVTKFGAFYDSTLDRVGDGVTFIGIAVYLMTTPGVSGPLLGTILCMVGILSSLVVSYARARAEGLGIDCKVGLVQRAERLLAIGLPSMIIGPGPRGLVLQWIVGVLAILSVVTVIQRFVYVYRVTEGAPGAPPAA